MFWFGTDNAGLIRFHDEPGAEPARYTTADGLSDNTIYDLFQDREGTLWIGTGAGGLNRLSSQFISGYSTAQGLGGNITHTVLQDHAGNVWVGAPDGGLNRFKDGRFTGYTIAQGFYDNSVFQILEDASGNFWMSCFRGLYSISKQQLNDFADGKLRAVRCAAYGGADGMLNSNCNGGRQPSGVKTADGKLWFTTLGGVAVVNPEAAPFNPLPPPVRIEEVKAAASAASVTIKRREGMIELTIADNGRGFEVADYGLRIAESGDGSGFGLLGLTERARILSCVPVITSAPGEGTTIQLKLAAGPREQRDAD